MDNFGNKCGYMVPGILVFTDYYCTMAGSSIIFVFGRQGGKRDSWPCQGTFLGLRAQVPPPPPPPQICRKRAGLG